MFYGNWVALVTPMHSDLTLDTQALLRLLDWHIAEGTAGIVILGTTGEAPTLSADERTELITTTLQHVAGRLPIIVGVGSHCTNTAVRSAKQAMQLGADGVLLVTPYYNRPTQRGLVAHCTAVADAITIPVMLYNVPTRTGCDLLPETVALLSQHERIVALKEATGDLSRLDDLLALDLDLALLSGDDETACAFIRKGGVGVVSVVGNIVPAQLQAMVQAARGGDVESAEALNKQLAPLTQFLFVESNPIPVKWLLSAMGHIKPGIRLPLTALAEEFHAQGQVMLFQYQLSETTL
jgi:4-hydroxy-tetrahydrodipicolinate synthase